MFACHRLTCCGANRMWCSCGCKVCSGTAKLKVFVQKPRTTSCLPGKQRPGLCPGAVPAGRQRLCVSKLAWECACVLTDISKLDLI